MVCPQAASDHIQLLSWSAGTWNSSLTPKSGDVFNPHKVLCSLEAPPQRGETKQTPSSTQSSPLPPPCYPSHDTSSPPGRLPQAGTPMPRDFPEFLCPEPLERAASGSHCPAGSQPPSWAPHSPSPHAAPGSCSTARARPEGTFFSSTSPKPLEPLLCAFFSFTPCGCDFNYICKSWIIHVLASELPWDDITHEGMKFRVLNARSHWV